MGNKKNCVWILELFMDRGKAQLLKVYEFNTMRDVGYVLNMTPDHTPGIWTPGMHMDHRRPKLRLFFARNFSTMPSKSLCSAVKRASFAL